VRRLGDIALFKVISESAVSAGVRRVEAVTGAGALAYLNDFYRAAREAAAVIRATPADLPERITQLMDERRKLERELAEARRQLAMGGGASAGPADEGETINGTKLMARILSGIDPKDLRTLLDQAKQKLGSGVIVLATASADGKAALVVGVTEDLVKRFNAVEMLRKAVEAVGGKGGGGRPDMAQGGGPDGAKLDAALEAVRAVVRETKS
jgi:alanyl-tRNA synthetase